MSETLHALAVVAAVLLVTMCAGLGGYLIGYRDGRDDTRAELTPPSLPS